MASFQPLAEQLRVTVSKQRLRIVPSNNSGFHGQDSLRNDSKVEVDNPLEEREFEVEVVNQSSRFASFEIELSTPGQPDITTKHWYDVEPKVCAKKPPGDRTIFRIVINRPPIPAINTVLELRVNVFSVEYEDLDTTHPIELAIEPRSNPLQVHLVSPYLKAQPGQQVAIEALAMNLQSEPAEITLKLLRLPQNWFTDSTEEAAVSTTSSNTLHLMLSGGGTQRATFYCLPPGQPLTLSDRYEFDVEISDSHHFTTTHGYVEVLPVGLVTFNCESRQQFIPDSARGWGLSGWNRAIFPLAFQNLSNLSQQVHIQANEANRCLCSIQPIAPIDLQPQESQTVNLEVKRNRPWLGWVRRLLIDVTPRLTYPENGQAVEAINLEPTSQTLDLRVRPVIPFWLQLTGGLLGLLMLAWWFWLRPISRHTAPITTLQIMGQESTVLSGSRDQSVYRWDVNSALGWFPHAPILRDRTPIASAEDLGKAVRVLRESPEDASRVAIGLENGVIELWDFDDESQIRTIADETDRVFALAFTSDGRTLFSGHGSGRVRQWDVQASEQSEPSNFLYLRDTAISDLAVLEPQDRSLVAIAGQFNRLVLWDWQWNIAYGINYSWERDFVISPVIGPYHTLTDVEVGNRGRLLATADNSGFVTLWDGQELAECTQRTTFRSPMNLSKGEIPVSPLPCSQDAIRLEQWQATANGTAVRTMAMTNDGCYLTTASDEGEIMLWVLDPQTGMKSLPDAIPIHQFGNYSPYEIDIKQSAPNQVLIAVDGPDERARLFRHDLQGDAICVQ